MIADDRGSQIADDRKESCFHIIADDGKRSQSPLLHAFRTAEVPKLHETVCWRENSSKQNGGRRGINSAASKIILLLDNRFWNYLGTSRSDPEGSVFNPFR